jgi:hypothetical protein
VTSNGGGNGRLRATIITTILSVAGVLVAAGMGWGVKSLVSHDSTLAVQEQRLNDHVERMGKLDKTLDDLRSGQAEIMAEIAGLKARP